MPPALSPVGSGLAAEQAARSTAIRTSRLRPVKKFSLWDDRQSRLFTDARALSAGDILTVQDLDQRPRQVQERIGPQPHRQAHPRARRLVRWDGAGTCGQGRRATSRSNTDTQGDGATTRSENIELSVAAVVTDVLPNGNLMISGSQEVRVNAELRILTIAGIVRPSDIGAREHDLLRPHRRGARLLWRPRPPHRGAAAALRPADPRHRPAVLRHHAMATADQAIPAKSGPSIVIQIGHPAGR